MQEDSRYITKLPNNQPRRRNVTRESNYRVRISEGFSSKKRGSCRKDARVYLDEWIPPRHGPLNGRKYRRRPKWLFDSPCLLLMLWPSCRLWPKPEVKYPCGCLVCPHRSPRIESHEKRPVSLSSAGCSNRDGRLKRAGWLRTAVTLGSGAWRRVWCEAGMRILWQHTTRLHYE